MQKHTNTPAATDLDDERIITTADLLARVPLDRSTVHRMVRAGTFPAPITLTASRIGWRWSAVARWLAEREANPPRRRTYPRNPKKKAA